MRYQWLWLVLFLSTASALPADTDSPLPFQEYLDLNLSPQARLEKPFTVFFLLDQNRSWDENCIAVSFDGNFLPFNLEASALYFPLQADLNAGQASLYRLHAKCASPSPHAPHPEPVESIADWQAFTLTSGCYYGNGFFYSSDCGSAGAQPPTLSVSAFVPAEKWLFSSSKAWMISTLPLPLDFNSFAKLEGHCASTFSWIPPQAAVGLTDNTSSSPTHTVFSSDCRANPSYTLYLKRGVEGIGFSQDNNRFAFIESEAQAFRLGLYAFASIRNSDQHGGAESASLTHSLEKISLFKRIEIHSDGNWQAFPLPSLDENAESFSPESLEPPTPSPPASAPAGGPTLLSPSFTIMLKESEGVIRSFRAGEGLAAFKLESAGQKPWQAIHFSAVREPEHEETPSFPLFILIFFLAPAVLWLKTRFKPKEKRTRKVPRIHSPER